MLHYLSRTLRFSLVVFWLASVGDAEEIARVEDPWPKHVIFTGEPNQTAVAADFTGDGKPERGELRRL